MQNLLINVAIAMVFVIIFAVVISWFFGLFLEKIEGKGRDAVKKLLKKE